MIGESFTAAAYARIMLSGVGLLKTIGGNWNMDAIPVIQTTLTIEQVLQKLYDHEQNVEISSFWDGGFSVRIGDSVNGYTAEAWDCKAHEIPEVIVNLIANTNPILYSQF